MVSPRGFDYTSLRRRIHPSPVRVAALELETPSTLVSTDLVLSGSDDMRQHPLVDRRLALERLAATMGIPTQPANLRRIVPGATAVVTPHTSDRSVATRWSSTAMPSVATVSWRVTRTAGDGCGFVGCGLSRAS